MSNLSEQTNVLQLTPEQSVTVERLWGPDLTNNFTEVLSFLSKVDLEEDKLQVIFQRMLNTGIRTYVAKIGTRIVATGSYYIEQKFIHGGGKVGHIEDVVVHPDFRGQHIGKYLVNVLATACKSEGCYKVILNCSRENIKYYKACGFDLHQFQMRMDFGDIKPSPSILNGIDLEIDATPGRVSITFDIPVSSFSLSTEDAHDLIVALTQKVEEAEALFIDTHFNKKPLPGDITDLKVIRRRFEKRNELFETPETLLAVLEHITEGLLKQETIDEMKQLATNKDMTQSASLVAFFKWINNVKR